MRVMRAAAVALLLLLGATTAAPSSEAVVPIRKITLPSGSRYFALPIQIGGKTLLTGIDTGSAGLRVLAPALDGKDYRATDERSTITFGSGETLVGIRAMADVGFGRVKGPVLIEVVQRRDCAHPGGHCVDGHLPMKATGLMGGAPAMIGTTRSDIPVNVPFPALGVRRWILDIPNDLGNGRLTLDPQPDRLKGFVSFPAVRGPGGKPQGAIRGCLRNERSGQELCGIISFDTGAPGISVSSPDPLPRHWPPHTPASLLYKDEGGRTRLVQHFVTGDPSHSSRLFFDDHPSGKQTVIHANASPYFCFDVMYEFGAPFENNLGPISLRPRRSGPHDPHAAYVN